MTLSNMLSGLQQLSTDAYLELFELDTSPLFMVHGIQQQGGAIYRWTSGIVDMRTQSTLPEGVTQTADTITLDQTINLMTGREYMLAVQIDPDHVPTPVLVSSFSNIFVTIGGVSIEVTQIVLSLPLSAAPVAGNPYVLLGTNPVSFQGNIYTPMPIEMSGMEWSGQGKLPRPTLRISNIGGLASALVIAHGDMLGATVTRIRTLREFLDDGTTPDPTSFTEPEIFTLDRKSSMTKHQVEWECAAKLDQQGIKIPRRLMIRDTCSLVYRAWVADAATGIGSFVYGDCPYDGANCYTIGDLGTLDPSQDMCSHLLQGCLLRYGTMTPLPIACFPGISVTRA